MKTFRICAITFAFIQCVCTVGHARENGNLPTDARAMSTFMNRAARQDGRFVPQLEWTAPDDRQPGTYADYLKSHPLTAGRFRTPSVILPRTRDRRITAHGFNSVSILIDQSLYDALMGMRTHAALDQYLADLGTEGCTVYVETISGGTPSEIKAWVKQRYAQGSGVVVFIGDITAAWAQVSDQTFPCDLYYMDMDGHWADTDGDGDFDVPEAESADEAPELCVARIDAHTLDYDAEATMVSDYLDKVHRYRMGTLIQPWRALEYIDHDWHNMDVATRLMFDTDVVRHDWGYLTTAKDYLAQTAMGQYYVQLAAHGNSSSFVLSTIPTESVAYAHTYIYSPSQRMAQLWLGSDDGIQVRWNGSIVLTRDESRSWKADKDSVTVPLNAGWNRLLCKISQGGGAFQFSAKLAGRGQGPYDDLVYQVSDPDTHAAEAEFVRGWLVNGFHQDISDNFWSYISTNYLGTSEAAIHPVAGHVTAGHTWTKVSAGNASLDFTECLGSHDYGACYAAATVTSPSRRDCQIWLGYDDGARVWLNGNMIFSDNRYGEYILDMQKVNVTLNAGSNRLLVKITQWMGAHGFSLRFCRADGTPVPGLTYDPVADPIEYIGAWAVNGPYLNEDATTRLGTDYLDGESSVRPSIGDAATVGTWQRAMGSAYPVDLGEFYNEQGWISSQDIQDHDPPILFYNLFVCGSSRFTDRNYLAGSHIFNTTYGLCVIGSSKTGSMLNFADFTDPMGRGETVGQSLHDWFTAQAPFEEWEKEWYYGMILSGDPTLSLFPADGR